MIRTPHRPARSLIAIPIVLTPASPHWDAKEEERRKADQTEFLIIPCTLFHTLSFYALLKFT